jgi:hypothetical protein
MKVPLLPATDFAWRACDADRDEIYGRLGGE